MTDDEIRALLDGATQGPWRVSDARRGVAIENRHGHSIGAAHKQTVYGYGRDDLAKAEQRNNGLLFAAAPDAFAEILRLREVLREADLQLAYLDERQPTGTTPAIRARIAAALKGAAE